MVLFVAPPLLQLHISDVCNSFISGVFPTVKVHDQGNKINMKLKL